MIDLDRIQSCVLNRIDPAARNASALAAVIGSSPSRYSKSPALWNAAFDALRINARYIALDIEESRLGDLMAAIRESPTILGLSVTVPHKIAVMRHLDALDQSASQTGAVNTIVRRADGKLYGANTDGAGFIETLLTPAPGEKSSLLKTLEGIDALVLGAGGSARAVAFALAEKIGGGKIAIANRNYENARRLAQEVSRRNGKVAALREGEISAAAPGVELLVNCTTKGQGGMAGEGAFEAYSALAPTPETPAEAARRENIEENHRISMEIAHAVPRETIFYDLIYHPEETVFMRHARATGHRTTNGRGMIVAQAVESFFNHICRPALETAGLHTHATRAMLRDVMDRAWTGTNRKS